MFLDDVEPSKIIAMLNGAKAPFGSVVWDSGCRAVLCSQHGLDINCEDVHDVVVIIGDNCNLICGNNCVVKTGKNCKVTCGENCVVVYG